LITSTSTGRRVHPAKPATVRHVNRSIVLNLVRQHQPISRARLAELMGIYRSSISDIVEELREQKALVERLSSPIGRGRVPIQLYLNPNGYRVLGVSVRPFHSFVATAGLDGKIDRTTSFRTPKKPALLMRELVRTVEHLKATDPRPGMTAFQQVGMGVPGMVNAATGVISLIPSLPEYAGFAAAEEVERQLGLPALVDNDCNVAALGELWLNPAEIAQLQDFVFLEIGDVGVGAGIVLGGSLYQGHDSTWAGEFGHMTVDPEGPECRCGRRGCWERYVCDEATWNRFDPTRPYSPAGFAELIQSAAARDSRALKALRLTAEYISLGIANIVCGLNPQMVLVSGEITKVWTLVEDIVRARWALPSLAIRVRPALMPLDQLSVQGAVALALKRAFGAPKLG